MRGCAKPEPGALGTAVLATLLERPGQLLSPLVPSRPPYPEGAGHTVTVRGRTQPASSGCGSRKRPMAGAQQCALPASSSREETAWPGRARQGTQAGASGDSWALANHGPSSHPSMAPTPCRGVVC